MSASVAARKSFPLSMQLARFGVIGAATVALDFALLFVLRTGLHLNYLLAAFLSFTVASTVNYVSSARYVFVGGRFGRKQEFVVFLATTAIGLGLNQLTMWLLVGFARSNYMIAKCFSLAIVTFWNFTSKKKIVFLD